MSETASVQALLAARIPEEPATQQQSNTGARQLEATYRSILEQLLQRPIWQLGDLRSLTSAAGLMPLACVARVNQWANENFGAPLLEGEDTIKVNQAIKKQII